jgi:cysteinyl-tRNA synthetase
MYTVREVLERGFTGRELRYALLSGANYAKNLNFTWQGMDDAKTALSRIDEWRKRIREAVGAAVTSERKGDTLQLLPAIDEAIAHDLNINELLGHLFTWIRTSNKALDEKSLGRTDALAYDQAWTQLDSILGLGDATISVPAEVQTLLDQRAAARQAKDFAKSDELRKAIEALGWKVKDTAKGQELLPG